MTNIPFQNASDQSFAPVFEAFKANFHEGLELGAQFCAYQHGQLLIDLKGGWSNRAKDTAVSDKTMINASQHFGVNSDKMTRIT